MLNQLGLNLALASRFNEACHASKNSVLPYRILATTDSPPFKSGLARSLLDLSNLRPKDVSEALPLIEESIGLHRKLVAVDPVIYTPDLTRSLNNLSVPLSTLGRHSEA